MALVEDDEVIDLADGVYEGELPAVEMVAVPAALVASAIPVKPPREWFDNPGLTEVTPLVIQSDGRVYGHIAGFKQDHIGMNGKVRAPHSRSDYAFFATGCLECDNGEMVNVGQISLVGGHAPLEASVAEAVAHYDNTDSAMMDVAIGEDKHGIWVAGALRPDVDDLKLRKLRASGVSGDWRPINGNLELVAVCAVNVPGFPTPRARVAAGQPVALVAAGTGEIVGAILAKHANGQTAADVEAIYASVDERLRMVEDVLMGRMLERRDSLTAAVDEAQALADVPVAESVDDFGDDGPDLNELRSRVHGTASVVASEPPAIDLDALRSRVHGSEPAETETDVWGDGLPVDMSVTEIVQASLRARVKGGPLVARATSHWDTGKRKSAAKRGTALPDGSFPISDKEDLQKAIKAFGRAKDKDKVKRHIRKRAKALGAESMIPDSWK